MSNQEVWITLRIKSQLPVEKDAIKFAFRFAARMDQMLKFTPQQMEFLNYAMPIEVLKVEEEGHLAGTREDKPYTLEE